MEPGYVPIFIHADKCCGMVVHLGTKEVGNNTTAMAFVCPLHGEVNPDDCRIWRQEDENRAH